MKTIKFYTVYAPLLLSFCSCGRENAERLLYEPRSHHLMDCQVDSESLKGSEKEAPGKTKGDSLKKILTGKDWEVVLCWEARGNARSEPCRVYGGNTYSFGRDGSCLLNGRHFSSWGLSDDGKKFSLGSRHGDPEPLLNVVFLSQDIFVTDKESIDRSVVRNVYLSKSFWSLDHESREEVLDFVVEKDREWRDSTEGGQKSYQSFMEKVQEYCTAWRNVHFSKGEIEQLKNKIGKARQKLESDKMDKEAELQNRIKEINQLNAHLGKIGQRLEAERKRKEELEQLNGELERTRQELETVRIDKEFELQSKIKEIDRLNAQLKKTRRDSGANEEEVGRSLAKIAESQRGTGGAKIDGEAGLRSRVKGLETEKDKLRHGIEELSKAKQDLDAEKDELRCKIEESSRAERSFSVEKDKLRRRIEELARCLTEAYKNLGKEREPERAYGDLKEEEEENTEEEWGTWATD